MNRLDRLYWTMSRAQKNEYHAAMGKYKNRYGTPDDTAKLHMMERLLVGKDPAEGLEPDGGTGRTKAH